MGPDAVARLARRLGQGLNAQGLSGSDPEEMLRVWLNTPPDSLPLDALDGVLRRHGLTLEGEALTRVAWALAGVPRPCTVRLGDAADRRLTHLAELHDLPFPSAARTLGLQLVREETLVPDLLRVRPWLEGRGLRHPTGVLEALLDTEWTGFLPLLGEFGPWVYVSSVADLQTLSRAYAALVWAAQASPDREVLTAALTLTRHDPRVSLLARLEVTDYRTRRPRQRATGGKEAAELIGLEEAFWTAAEHLARQRRDGWAARRR